MEDMVAIQLTLQNEVDSVKNMLTGIQETIDCLIDENHELKNENAILENRIRKLENYNDEILQRSMECDLEICGVPEAENENLDEVIQTMMTSLKLEANPGYINDVYRKKIKNKNSGMPGPIIIKFNRKSYRDALLAEKKIKKKLDSSLIFPDAGQENIRPIYINECITNFRKLIHKNARELMKKDIFKFVWIKDGKILVRKSAESNIINIRSIDDLNAYYK